MDDIQELQQGGCIDFLYRWKGVLDIELIMGPWEGQIWEKMHHCHWYHFFPKAMVKTRNGLASGGGVGLDQVGTVDSTEVLSQSVYLKADGPEGKTRDLVVNIIVS